MISYENIHDSTVFYEKRGYSRLETPWTVSKYVAHLTKPKDAADKIDYELNHNKKVLVASGEQSFLYLYLKGFLPLGRYQTVTPCFRDELFDETHTKYFLKNEIMITDYVNDDALQKVIKDALGFFETKLKEPSELKVVESECGFDIEYKGIELGSYGMRKSKFLEWIFATGCAEPRLSFCQKLK